MVSSTTAVLLQVADERKRQEDKWGQQNHDPFTYLAILGEEFGEACQVAVQATMEPDKNTTWDDYRDELIQIAAVAVAMVECLDRNVNKMN